PRLSGANRDYLRGVASAFTIPHRSQRTKSRLRVLQPRRQRVRAGRRLKAGGAWSSNKVLVVRGRPRGTLPPSGAVPTIPRARRGSSSERTHLENCRRTWSSPPAPPPDTFRPAASSL